MNGRHSIPEAMVQQPVYKRRRTGCRISETPDGVEEPLSSGDVEQLLEL